MKKVGIMSMQRIANYGSFLQAYALKQLSRREHVSEKLKEENQMEWVRRMRNLENRAAEIVKAELIYTFERR